MISKDRVNELIKKVLEERDNQKNSKAYITGVKEEIGQFLIENNLTEYSCDAGIVKINDSSREGLEREKVEAVVSKVNDKKIDYIDMKDITKQINIHSISVKANKGDK